VIDDDGEDITPDDSIQDAIEWYHFVCDTEHDQDKQEQEALQFQHAEGAWPDDVKGQFSALAPNSPQNPTNVPVPARPMLSVASADEPILLQVAQFRQAHLAVRIHPVSDDANDETANIIQSLYQNIERDSRADIARGWAYERGLWCGRGVYRVNKVFDSYGGHELDQKITIERILDQSTVKRDPYAQQPDWSDGTRLQITVPMSFGAYKARYPKSRVGKFSDATFDSEVENSGKWLSMGTDDNRRVTVCEEWRVETNDRKKSLLDDHSMGFDDEDLPEGRTKLTGKDARSSTVTERRVFRRVINYTEVLEPEVEWDGQYLPFPTAIGRELQVTDGRRSWLGMIGNAKGAIRLTNYAATNAIRMAALEPRAPFIGVEGVFEGHAEWGMANIRDFPYLEYKPTDLSGRPAPPPQRNQVDMSRLGPSMQLLSMGKDFVQTAMATYGPALGTQTPAHRSGKAIEALQGQTISANSPYIDNFANITMTYEAMIILDLIPKVYDRPQRIAKILDDKNVSSWVMLNHPFVMGANGRPIALPYETDQEKAQADAMVNDPNHPAKHYDLTKGRYGLEVTIGKSYKDKRDEAVGEMGIILQADPQMMQIIGPEYFREKGEAWAAPVADLLEKHRDHQFPWLAKNPQQVDPMKVQAENQQLKQQLQQAGQIIQTKQVETQGKIAVTQIQEQAETARDRAANETKIAVAELGAKVDRLSLFLEERARLGIQGNDNQQAGLDRAHEAAMASGDHQAQMAQSDQQHQQAVAQAQQGAANTASQSILDAAQQPQPEPAGTTQ
jgi:hypothetical protein